MDLVVCFISPGSSAVCSLSILIYHSLQLGTYAVWMLTDFSHSNPSPRLQLPKKYGCVGLLEAGPTQLYYVAWYVISLYQAHESYLPTTSYTIGSQTRETQVGSVAQRKFNSKVDLGDSDLFLIHGLQASEVLDRPRGIH